MPQAKKTVSKSVKVVKPVAKKVKAVKPAMAKKDMKDGGKMTQKEKFLEMINSKKKKK
jgi:hypothetical protein